MDEHGIRLVTIVKEDLDGEIADFQAKVWPSAEVFVDEKKELYRVASQGKLQKAGLLSFLCCAVCCSKRRRQSIGAANKEHGNNFKGEGLILGSILVVDSTGTVVYAHAEKAFDDHPDFSDVVAAAVQHALTTKASMAA